MVLAAVMLHVIHTDGMNIELYRLYPGTHWVIRFLTNCPRPPGVIEVDLVEPGIRVHVDPLNADRYLVAGSVGTAISADPLQVYLLFIGRSFPDLLG